MSRIGNWWKSRTTNEKLMIGLILALVVGICTRWNYVWSEIADAFSSYFDFTPPEPQK